MKKKENIQRRKPNINFNLQRMEDIFDNVQGGTDVPHRHDYYTVLFVEQAKGKHVVDYQTYNFSKSEVHFVAPGQVHQVVLTDRPNGWVLTFSREFLMQNRIPESFITNINLFKSFGDSSPLKLDKTTFDRLARTIKEMETCLSVNLTYRVRALGALLQLFLIYCNNSANLDDTQLKEDDSSISIFRNFKNLVELKFTEWHKVKNYALEIHISPKHLSSTVKKVTGKSAKEIIQDRILIESKRLLLHTNMTIKEVAYAVGFVEPLHFSGFFKKRAGTSPSQFREER